MNPDFQQENLRETERLRTLVSWLSDEDFQCVLENGWTVAATLAHLAFWDEQRKALLLRWRESGVEPVSFDQDSINEGVKLLANALPSRAAAELAVNAAEDIDKLLGEISPEMASKIEASGQERVIRRSLHRKMHLDEIEKALREQA